MAVNEFADMTLEEFSAKYLGKLGDEPKSKCEQAGEELVNLAGDDRQVDWVAAGKVQAVKNQRQCGSCWAFSAVGALESAYAIFKNEDVPSLSEQELVDCSKPYGNQGCNGGLMGLAYDYVLENKLNTEDDYPYVGRDQACNDSKKGKGAFGISKCINVEANTNGLTEALKQQPVAVALHAGYPLMFYHRGILNPFICSGEVNHGVLAVGFDLTNAKPFYKVKNSWGSGWGEQGYFRIAIGKKPAGVCNIAGNGNNYYPVL